MLHSTIILYLYSFIFDKAKSGSRPDQWVCACISEQERFFPKFAKNHAGLGFLEEDWVLVNMAEKAQQGTLLFEVLCIKVSFVILEAIKIGY